MRPLAFALVVLGFASPVSAQSRFVEACVASSAEASAADRALAEAVCACGAERALQPDLGLAVGHLDALIDFVDPSADRLSLDGAPEAVQGAAVLVVAAMTECLVMQRLEDLAQALGVPDGATAGAPAARVRPAGPHLADLGDGAGTTRSTRASSTALRVED